MRRIEITESILRDGNQSLCATRMPLSDFVPILNKMDSAGYYSVECWGGATFDACIRYLDEDPWERLKVIRREMPTTKLQMLLRGKNLLGYKHYSDYDVRKFVDKSIENGIDIIRIFDAMNDIHNIEVAVDQTIKSGGIPSCAICYTSSPVHNIGKYVDLARDMVDIGARSICIKDMSGLLFPDDAEELIKKLKETVDVPIILHSHCTTGLAYMTYERAIHCGVDVLDTVSTSFSGGSSLPSTGTIVSVLKKEKIACSCNEQAVYDIDSFFRPISDKYIVNGVLPARGLRQNLLILKSQVPGGMYTNLYSQCESYGVADKFDDILNEIPRVRADLGYPPLVTPISQVVGTQSLLNILHDERYKIVIDDVIAYINGAYGEPPAKVDESLVKKVTNQKYKTCSIQEVEELYELYKSKYKDYSELDLLTVVMFPETGLSFVKKKNESTNENGNIGHKEETTNDDFLISVDSIPIITPCKNNSHDEKTITVCATMPGKVIDINVEEKQLVDIGDELFTIESMKMENHISSSEIGIVSRINVKKGDYVKFGDELITLLKE